MLTISFDVIRVSLFATRKSVTWLEIHTHMAHMHVQIDKAQKRNYSPLRLAILIFTDSPAI